jgi:hypothetical protein
MAPSHADDNKEIAATRRAAAKWETGRNRKKSRGQYPVLANPEVR